MQRIKDLTVEEFKAVVGEAIEEKFRELLAELDLSVTLRRDVSARAASPPKETEPKTERAAEPEIPRRQEMEW